MYTTGKKEMTFDGPSYYQQPSRKYYRDDTVQALRAKLASNFAKMTEVFAQRKQLLKKLAQVMMSENSAKLQQIAKAKTNELKNEARALKDQTALMLLQNSEKYNSGNRTIIRSIMELNPKTMDTQQSKKSKQYYDEIKRIDTDRTMAISKFKQQSTELTKYNDEQRRIFREIQLLEQNKIAILTSKQYDHIKKAQKIEEQIDKNKLVLKSNRTAKEKRKRELAFEIEKILEMTKRYENVAISRGNQIGQMIGGCESVQEFEQFVKSFQTVVINRVDTKKQDQALLIEIVRRAAFYDKQAEQMQKQVTQEAYLFDTLSEAYKKNVTIALLQRAYLTNLPTDRNSLMSILSKCQAYRSVLERLAEEKSKAKWETDKARQVLDYFEPILKGITTEEKRREEMKEKIARIMNSRSELEKMEKKQQNFEFELTNLLLQKEAISKPMQEAARKGQLQEYKLRTAQLEKIEQEIAAFSQTKNDVRFKEQTAKLNLEIEQLHREYSTIIEEMLAGEKEMTFYTFLEKLSQRLMLV